MGDYEFGLFLDIALPEDEQDEVTPESLQVPSTLFNGCALLFYMKPGEGRVETSSRKVFAL